MSYEPRPIPTEDVVLPDSLAQLEERLAANVHDIWAQKRLREGWRHGEARDDLRRRHPCLIPYEELSDEDKSFDRDTAMQTLKAILALGYRIEPPRG